MHKILEYLELLIPKEDIIERADCYILPTICHNHNHKQAAQKLYLYKNEDSTPLFHCYTSCNETFNIYQLVQKYASLRGEELTYREAFKKFHGVDYVSKPEIDIREIKYDKKFKNPLAIELPEYLPYPLDMFRLDETHPWRHEGMEITMLESFGIGYSRSLEQVCIPHHDWRGRLIGIRVRNFDEYKAEQYKYMPLAANGIYYSHPLSLNFYGIFQNQIDIKRAKRVYLYEAEKSVFFHNLLLGNNLALAVCGKNISKWHMDMLIHFLGVEEVVVCFDKEYETYNQAFEYVKRIESQTSYLQLFAKVGVMIDDNNVMNLKQAPVDGTISQFNSMNIWWLE